MIRYFDNIVFSLQKTGGISRVWALLCKGNNRNNSFFIENKNSLLNYYRKNINLSNVIHSEFKLFERYRPYSINRKNKFIFHSSYFRYCNNEKAINITTIHDMIYEKFRNNISALPHKLQKKISIEKSKYIICVSNNSKIDFLSYYKNFNPDNVFVAHNPVSSSFKYMYPNSIEISKFIGTNVSYFVYVGNREGNCKNFDRVFDLLKIYKFKISCVVIGNKLTNKELTEINKKGLTKNIINIINPSDEVLNLIYANAKFLFFPSSYEGFGLPPLEAMKSGCPVLCTKLSSLPEILGESAIFFDLNELTSLYDAKIKLDSNYIRNNYIELGLKHAENFSEENFIKSYDAIFNEIEKREISSNNFDS